MNTDKNKKSMEYIFTKNRSKKISENPRESAEKISQSRLLQKVLD